MSKSEQIAFALQRIEELTAEVAELKKLHGGRPDLVDSFRKGMETEVAGLVVEFHQRFDQVEVIRYLRKPSSNHNSNLGGVTLAFRLDYESRIIEVAYAICAEDENFDKTRGTLGAMARLDRDDDVIPIAMQLVTGPYAKYSLVDAMFFVLSSMDDEVPSSNWKRIRNVWGR